MATSWSSAYHAPVLVAEVLAIVDGAATALDGTLGGGGHAEAMLVHGVRFVVGVDRDPAAIAAARERLASYERDGRFRAVRGNYADLFVIPSSAERDGRFRAVRGNDADLFVIRSEARELHVQIPRSARDDNPLARDDNRLRDDNPQRFDVILLDLGVSSRQLDAEDRGFTFREGAPLDMRMDSDDPVDAAAWLNESDEKELARVFKEYADEPKANRLAREITKRRGNRVFHTSDDLVGAIRAVLGPRSGPADFARIFQAVRIAVNDELSGLAASLPALRDRLTPGGRLIVISYHSGEDRIVKHAFRDWSSDCICPPRQPKCTCRGYALGETLTRKSVTAGDDEVRANPRARSARLRAWRKN
jgi:16S rRNA (cytosine1402-N4)-methyltransferase